MRNRKGLTLAHGHLQRSSSFQAPMERGGRGTPAPNLNGLRKFPTEALRLEANKQGLKAQVAWEEEKLY
ncbi:unnamed protein product [Miscanthus lutarioriparius]|uniref:Uncharacterized protein n=1 Tax=Miscanthus lutarioriparius TaxID=422564 RepID=A0A811QX14_9POAL|nr:unnamed protein product [Miscanthus lutarioriparius]